MLNIVMLMYFIISLYYVYLCICKLIWKLVDNGLIVFLQLRIGARPNVNLNYKKKRLDIYLQYCTYNCKYTKWFHCNIYTHKEMYVKSNMNMLSIFQRLQN